MRGCFSPSWVLLLLAAFLGAQTLRVRASDCPLDLSWSNFTLIASTCSSGNERPKCCRFINAIVAVSVARYAKSTGQLGVPPAFSEMCINSITDTLSLYGIQPSATSFCGLGTKILVNYQCKGRETVLEMLQSPNFTDVMNNCKKPLSADASCRRCLNSDMLFLHHVLGADDNVTLSTCRNAAFVALTNQGDQLLTTSIATCLFGIQGLGVFSGNISVAASPSASPESSPGLASAGSPPPPVDSTPSKDLAKEHHHPFRLTLVQGLGIGVTALAVSLLIILVLLIRKKSRELNDTASPASSNAFPPPSRRFQEGPPSLFKRFSYREAKKATHNFSTEIGKGGFGTVYKAQFSDGSLAAIKQMNRLSQQGENDFCKEMELLGRLHHRHLVALKGFCVEKRERFLVYEFMEKGSLKDNLHGQGRTPLSWEARMQIAIDVANALEYLHFYCDPPLCHRDIKSSNILLDENLVAKVADFGLAHASRNGSISFEPVNTDIRGTPGYMDPEYVVTQELTEKSDIYSYGVVLLELVTGRRAIQDNRNIVEWSQKFMSTYSQLHELVDPLISDSYDFEQLQVIVGIAQCCTQQEGKFRPSIKQVLRMLYEGLDPGQREFAEAIGDFDDEDVGYGGLRISKGKSHRSVTIPLNGETRCLMSSSSTSRSYCSRSLLLESGSPESPINIST